MCKMIVERPLLHAPMTMEIQTFPAGLFLGANAWDVIKRVKFQLIIALNFA